MKQNSSIKFNRIWSMPNRWTFQIKCINRLIHKYGEDFNNWSDPFAGMTSPAEFTNDLNPDRPATYHMEALEFLNMFKTEQLNGVLFDPPYSPRQVKECYEGIGLNVTSEQTKQSFYSTAKNKMATIIKTGGYAICCGWNSNGLGKNRGFKMLEVLLVVHGGSKNDTIVTVERKFQHNILINI